MHKNAIWAGIAIIAGIVVLFSLTKNKDNPSTANQSSSSTVYEHQLDNGMKILVQPDTRSPVVVSQVWYKIGSSYEYNGITGISHMLEHMMFKGTKELAPGEFSEIIAKNGGRENAFTSRDYTAYFQTIANDRLELCLRLEADRMRNVIFKNEEFLKERDVVAEERRLRYEDQPRSLTYEQFNATAFVSSPYRHPVIGWMEDIQAYNVADLEAWYKAWYAPNNATLVVVGDVDPQQVFKLAEKYFGPLQAGEIQPPKPQLEIPQRGKRRIEVQAASQVPYLLMGYKVPSLKNIEDPREAYALEVLAGILDGGDSARLSRQLVRGKQLAASAGAGYNLYSRMDSLFILSATPVGEIPINTLEQAILAEIEQLKQEPVSATELERVKTQVVAADIYQRDSMFYQGMRLGILETVGLGWTVMNDYVENIQSVTAEQVQAVANKYFINKHLTVAELVPTVQNSQP